MVADALGVDRGSGRMLMSDYDQDGRVRTMAYAGALAGILIPILIWVFVAMQYKREVTDKRPATFPQVSDLPPDLSLASMPDFKYGLCACKEDRQYCWHGWCLEGIRTGDSYKAAGVGSFWGVLGAFLITWLVAQVLGLAVQVALYEAMRDSVHNERLQRQNVIGNFGWYVANFFLAAYLASLRQKLRSKLGDPQPGGKYCQDLMFWWWCSCCVSIQEARQVDEATGTRVACCFQLSKVEPPAMQQVGQPAVVVVGNGQPVVVQGTVLG